MSGPRAATGRDRMDRNRWAAGLIVGAFVLVIVLSSSLSDVFSTPGSRHASAKGTRDRGRMLHHSPPKQISLASSSGSGLFGGGAAPSAPTGSEPTLARQNSMVAAALDHVTRAADADEKLRWQSDPETEAARSAALAAMMGLRAESGPSHSARDASMHRARRAKDMVEAIRGCRTLECLKMGHTRPVGTARFNFPHFLLIGWSKTATSLLFTHLNHHPEVSRPWVKEPEFFSQVCGYDVPSGCAPNDTDTYIAQTLRVGRYSGFDGGLAQYEASTGYAAAGERLAAGIYDAVPWAKIVAVLRDPISRVGSILVDELEQGSSSSNGNNGAEQPCLARADLGRCLLEGDRLTGEAYAAPLGAWLAAWPEEQVHLIQYEALVDPATEASELKALKKFLGLDPKLPGGSHASLGAHAGGRRGRTNRDGWPVKKADYEAAVVTAQRDAEAVARLLSEKGLGDGQQWMARWKSVWEENLGRCDAATGECSIKLT